MPIPRETALPDPERAAPLPLDANWMLPALLLAGCDRGILRVLP
jgi:hypothetical protein